MLASLAVTLVAVLPPHMSDEDAARARVLIESMKNSPRGPYRGIAWFCEDGSVLPPRPFACRARGGGRQHGVLRRDARRLVALGLPVGTILASLSEEDFLENDQYRARAYLLERYLVRTQRGWVLNRARSYRGASQAEDEAAAAQRLLIALSLKGELLSNERSLLLQLARALPFGQSAAEASKIRDLATELSEEDRAFLPLRARIHGQPALADAEAVRAFSRRRSGAVAEKARALADRIEQAYAPEGRRRRFAVFKRMVEAPAIDAELEKLLSAPDAMQGVLRSRRLLARCDRRLLGASGAQRAALLGIMALTGEILAEMAAGLSAEGLTRRRGLDVLLALFDSAGYLGILSPRERTALTASVRSAAETFSPKAYADMVARTSRALEWARARYLVDLGPALPRYQAVEPAAFGIVDELLRSGLVLALGALLDRFAADAEGLRSGGHVLPELSPSGVRGENPGIEQGVLRVIPPGARAQGLRRDEIVLVFEAVPDLPPISGILTVGSPSSLSHVSLLAQNLGIPHAAVTGATAEILRGWAGERVVLGVSESRRVVLGRTASLPEGARAAIDAGAVKTAAELTIDARKLVLDEPAILPLAALGPKDAGARVGPKAAELARLRTFFPKRVSGAFVLPFSTFLAHVGRPLPGRRATPWDDLKAAYQRAKTLSEDKAEAFLLEALEAFRAAINTLPLRPELIRQVKDGLRSLGPDNTFGAFVRSDTNVEDLESFTGAGLNKTVPNVVGLSSTLAAIREVWASPFSERSFRWRQRILSNPEHVYPSVIVQRTVPSEISGVLVTMDLVSGDRRSLTISASEGVAAVVDGGAAETIVVEPDGNVRLLSSSRVYARKKIPRPPMEGVVWAPAMKDEPLLTSPRLAELTSLAREVVARMPKTDTAWDIEFGLVEGRAYLFQIRPLRPSRLASTHPFLRELDERAQLPEAAINPEAVLP